jgi:hypothetical protein
VGRGTAEEWIKESQNAVKLTRLSCHDFKENQVWLQLLALAYDFGNFLRQRVLLRSVKHWSLTTLREKLARIEPKVVRHAWHVILQMAEIAVPRESFRAIIGRIKRIGLRPPLVGAG